MTVTAKTTAMAEPISNLSKVISASYGATTSPSSRRGVTLPSQLLKVSAPASPKQGVYTGAAVDRVVVLAAAQRVGAGVAAERVVAVAAAHGIVAGASVDEIAPVPAQILSFPPPPLIVSTPPRPTMRSGPGVPLIVSEAAEPEMVASAPKQVAQAMLMVKVQSICCRRRRPHCL